MFYHPGYNIRAVTKILILTQILQIVPKYCLFFLVSFNIAAHNWLCFTLCVLFENFICQDQERKTKLQIKYELRIIILVKS